MENKNLSVQITRKKILSLIGLIIFSLAFIFACMKSFLPFGNWIVCTFGIMTYPLFLILALVELAKFLGLSYRRSVKTTIYALILIVSLLFVIQAISTYKELDKVASFKSFKAYLDFSYNSKVTIVGSFGSIFVGGLSILLGAMGTIVAFVILFTISIGLIVDYEHYGKFEDNVKKLKNKKIREKVSKSDAQSKNGVPAYEFNKNDEIAGTLEVSADELNFEQKNHDEFPAYTDEDVIGEIVNKTESLDNQETYSNHPFTYQDEDSLNQSRRDFIGGTFGGFQSSQNDTNSGFSYNEQVEPTLNYDSLASNTFDEISIPTTASENKDIWGGETEPDIDIDETLKNILSQNEEEVDTLSADETISSFGVNNTNFGFAPENQSSAFMKPSNPFAGDKNLGAQNFSFAEQSTYTNPCKQENMNSETFNLGLDNNFEKRNEGILTSVKQATQRPQCRPKVPSANQIPMTGVRYNPPPLSLLQRPVVDKGNYAEEQARKSKQLEDVLESFNVPAKVVNIVRGPKITRYELSVPLGVSVKKIPNYELDIQSALAAKTITIQAPIPGSNFVGIELENDTFTSVYERELFESPEFQNAKGALPIAIGKDISGQIIVKNLTKMVHCLIAGSTGSGKSVFIHNIVLSLIYKYSPEDLRLVMVDPKRVEFGFYNGLPHLVTPEVVLGTEKAVSALKWCVKEMDRRFEIMGRANYKNIEDYNKSELVKSGQFEHFPYIVIIVDELAEIMTLYKKEAEVAIQRITQLARACGMHLIVAVQRPSVDIITGVIKNNISSRFAFRLQSGFDSKTMLGTNGAEKLLGQGDMLMSLTESSAMPRLQAAYASDDEIKAVVDFVKKNNPSNFDENAEKAFNLDPQASDDVGNDGVFVDAPQSKGKVDEYFKIAVKSVMMCGSASVSYLQRRLSIGYSRAARIVDQMEEKGYIAPPTGAKTRKVLITPEQFREEFGEEYNS